MDFHSFRHIHMIARQSAASFANLLMSLTWENAGNAPPLTTLLPKL